MPTLHQKNEFLQNDFYDALRWLFVGAVTWHATQSQPERCAHQRLLGMYTCLVQARALYEFYSPDGGKPDDARAHHFAPSWPAQQFRSPLRSRYMAGGKPANKRVFHLVYDRSRYAGGPGHDGPDHIKNQALVFASDLRRLTDSFITQVEPHFRHIAESALHNALQEAARTAASYGIANPL